MSSTSHILDLPVDLLGLILRPLLVTTDEPVPICPCSSSPIDPLPIFLIHPALYAIACPVFYASNDFLLDLTGSHGNHVRRPLEELAAAARGDHKRRHQRHQHRHQYHYEQDMPVLPPSRQPLLLISSALRRIHRLRVRIDRRRGWIDPVVVPRLSDMAVRGSLARIELSVFSAAATKPSSLRDFTTPRPLTALLNLLADPYLAVAQLKVQRAHGVAWCQFHAPNEPCTRLQEKLSAIPTEAGRMVDIDWRELLRDIDPEQREHAVASTDTLAERSRV